ncbi:MAG: flippase-like domain-containing protein [Candidatus Peregrinibacteria bacterium]|nr:flippase-like domain-containing protein [Candidatus Peregrinibacteria bacterium]MCB9807965.1 flippase-like domain-containing protein [Candidatus Peribacteria bacterium]
MKKRISLWLLKLIGVGLFIVILSYIDREALISQLQNANVVLLGVSFPLVFLIYFCKTMRWKGLVNAAGISLSLEQHWKIVNIGIFLASISPGKIGELGKAAYLKVAGMNAGVALALSILDRLMDVAFIGLIATLGVGIFFGWEWTALLGFGMLIATLLAVALTKKFERVTKHVPWSAAVPASLWTIAAWLVSFLWITILARSIGIDVPVHILIMAFTIVGILVLLPIAPSGLGTRDAALVFLLAPFGVPSEQAVALALLMFISIILSGILGGWYFVKGVR